MDEELNNLIKKLRDETSFVQSEKKHLIEIYSQLVKKSEKLFNKQWLINRQHLILDDLIFGRNRSTLNRSCSKFSHITNNHNFIESYKVLSHNDYYISEFLKALREKPNYLANFIVRSEKINSLSFLNSTQLINGVDNQLFSTQHLIPIVFQSLYGNCVLIQDEYFCLQLLKNLMEIQFSTNEFNSNEPSIDLRKLIRKQSCSFNILFKLYTSFSYSAQLFLITALHEPINQILTDEWFLDIDSDKALARFSTDEIINKFGHPTSKEYKLKTQKYREKIVNLLYNITISFIDSINSSLYSFPASLTWLVNHLFKLVNKNCSKTNQSELARKLCCDLIMALYICPAICDPEPYGIISDVQVSNVARHNLMQIANILQVLAMSDDDKDPKAQDLYCKFRNNCVSDILNNIITTPKSKNQTTSNSNELQFITQFDSLLFNQNNDLASNISTTSSVTNSSNLNTHNLVFRTSIMISLCDINRLVIYLRQLSKEQNNIETDESKWLKSIIPFDYINQALENAATSLNSLKKLSSGINNNLSSENSEVIMSLLKEPNSDEGYQILVLNISDKGFDCPGMLAEEKVINEYELNRKTIHNLKKNSKKRHHHHQNRQINFNNDNLDNSFEPSIKLQSETGIDRDEVRSRHDGSVEGISEVCDTNDCRSISSNDEDDVVNQNRMNDLDDDVNPLGADSDFDNFSGRDTPIISGRDTPSSHSHEDLHNISSSRNGINNNNLNSNTNSITNGSIMMNGNPISNSMNPSRGPQLPITVQKANREDINDKFCKFEINKINPVKEEQLSETGWSLDADPPESVTNEPINDRLGIDESSLSSRSTSNNLRVINSSSSMSSNVANNNSNSVINQNNNIKTNLISLGNEQDFSSISNLNINSSNSTVSIPNSNAASSNLVNLSSTTSVNGNETDQNLDDHFSVVSDSAAWSTDMINNTSDSDLESNSPSKYTPYSTYSSNCSSTHPPFNQSLINDFTSSNNLNSSQNLINNNNNNINNNNNNNLFPSSQSLLINPNNTQSAQMPLSSSVSSAMNNALINSDLNPRINSFNNSGSLNNQNDLVNTITSSSSSNQLASNNNKNKLASIFASNTNSVKFSLTSTLDKMNISNSQNKKNGLYRLFPFNKSSNNSNSPTIKSNDPFASLNPFSSSTQNQNQPQQQNENLLLNRSDNSNVDNILNKYKSVIIQPQTSSQSTPQSQSNDAQLIDLSIPATSNPQAENISTQVVNNPSTTLVKNFSSNSLQYDSNNLEQSKVFLDAKKKLRLVLSWPDCLTYNFMPNSHLKSIKDNFLTMYLRVQLYDSISLQDKEKEAQLYETIRCVSIFNEQECYKLLRSLKRDYLRRVYYMTYLTKSKQNILYSLNLADKLSQRAEWHQKLRTHHFASVITRLFLETKENENQIYKFIHDFRQLVAVDEKFDLFKKYLQLLKKDYDILWSGCQDELIQLGHLCLERLLLSKVYSYVMYPNGEIDHYRDSKVSECLNELANSITPSHPLIGISPIYLNECPWTAAQMELKRLNIYRTPQDKLACIRKCMIIIQNLLAIAKSPVCADDLHPVLIYVIIKANPPTFLSNVQYIEGFYGKQLELEDYYWAQFIFAFSYIKANMLNKV